MLLIVLNTLLLMMKYHGQKPAYERIMRYINMGFTGLFSVEAILKIFGFGFKVTLFIIIFCLNNQFKAFLLISALFQRCMERF